MSLITLFLTCANQEEANKISKRLLDDKLAACARATNVRSDFIWNGQIDHSDEVMLIIESIEEKFDEIESTINKLHSYKTFVLTAYPVSKSSKGVEQWVQESLKKKAGSATMNEAKLYTDGGSRGNPGPSATAFVICKMDDTVVEKSGSYIGETTNNQAEYQALKAGLEQAVTLGIKDLSVFMDSELIVKQVSGIYKIKNQDLMPHYLAVTNLAKRFNKISFTHVPRALNKEADAEVNRILDEYKNQNS